MANDADEFRHPYDTLMSGGLRFLSELIAWVAGPWAVGQWSNWLILPALVLLMGLPGVFSTPNDKRQVVVSTPGPIRVMIELLLYLVAAVAPWYVWPKLGAWLAVGIVIASIAAGIPRLLWLLRGAPAGNSV